MSEYNNTVASVIDQIIKYIPVVWPLQQFVATNPCWDLIDQPIEQLSSLFNQMGNIQMTLPLSQYWNYYQAEKISDAAVHQAIAESLTPVNKKSDQISMDSVAVKLCQQLLYGFMAKSNYQQKLIKQVESTGNNQVPERSILFSSQIQTYGYENALALIKEDCLNWMSAYFNPTAFQKKIISYINNKKHDAKLQYCFFDFWHSMMLKKGKQWRSILSDYSGNLEVFIENLLSELSLPEAAIHQYLFEICWQLKGWVGYIKWQQQYPNNPYFNQAVNAIEIIAMWLAYEVFWLKTHRNELMEFSPTYDVYCQGTYDDVIKSIWLEYINDVDQDFTNQTTAYVGNLAQQYEVSFQHLCWLWQRAYEISYQQPLYLSLLNQKRQVFQQKETQKTVAQLVNLPQLPKAQWVFCIDVRSEGFRRYLERIGWYETFGFAGFFGFAYQLNNTAQHQLTCQCPALIEPTLLVEMLNTTKPFYHHIAKGLEDSIRKARKSFLAPFALYEILGFWFALTLVVKNYGNHFLKQLKKFYAKNATENKRHQSTDFPQFNFDQLDLETMVSLARELLKGIGLVDNFAEFVIICGHSATTENNPYQAALDCGACGGNSGMSNAIIACQALNKSEVRAALADHGIVIPNYTVFVAACHDTTTDKVHWYEDITLLTEQQCDALSVVKKDTIKAGKQLQKERFKTLPGDQNVLSRSRHWAELIPEWGLANNAAMIIAPRQLTAALNLERRVFLHSYESEQDPDGSILASILLGPMVVAHWISSQYYFSSVNPDEYASGNKAIHNLLPYIGVMEGNHSDLKYGLPLQSVYYQNKCMHDPQRLCVFIDARQNKIDDIINKYPVLQSLVNGKWVFIKSLCVS